MAVSFGYHLSSEEHPPQTLVRNAVRAEEAGFDLCILSDHYHPWLDAQGQIALRLDRPRSHRRGDQLGPRGAQAA